ncbi:hypothetical protein HOC01_04610 [archaeon]|jgi:hypothetical protein|nr:hypothetical protein [archaeon]MBT6698248.1 hypothetical protein [archaeon]
MDEDAQVGDVLRFHNPLNTPPTTQHYLVLATPSDLEDTRRSGRYAVLELMVGSISHDDSLNGTFYMNEKPSFPQDSVFRDSRYSLVDNIEGIGPYPNNLDSLGTLIHDHPGLDRYTAVTHRRL